MNLNVGFGVEGIYSFKAINAITGVERDLDGIISDEKTPSAGSSSRWRCAATRRTAPSGTPSARQVVAVGGGLIGHGHEQGVGERGPGDHGEVDVGGGDGVAGDEQVLV